MKQIEMSQDRPWWENDHRVEEKMMCLRLHADHESVGMKVAQDFYTETHRE